MSSLPLVAWLVAGVCFIFSLGGLSQHETARRGNILGIIGITLAIVATIFSGQIHTGTVGFVLLFMALGAGGAAGLYLAQKVEMTSMPQLVAILHSFVGLAAVLVGLSNHLISHPTDAHTEMTPAVASNGLPDEEEILSVNPMAIGQSSDQASDQSNEHPKVESNYSANLIHQIEIFLGILIGGYTFTGSVIAWGKLDGRIDSTPLLIPGRHWINLGMLILCFLLLIAYVSTTSTIWGMLLLILVTLISFGLGAHMVMAIGGADMPVVVSMLNSYSGWAAAAIGFLLPNDLLIVTGALVGSSGAILSYIMCRAMNRSFISVIAGGFGTGTPSAAAAGDGEQKTYTSVSAEETAALLKDSKEVIVVPGYGMAVAQAQHPIREITEALKERGTRTRFAIHPVAGRLPGHMNVLLAEANVPYDYVLEMDEINEDFPETDVVLVIGANDIVNPGALDDPTSPIYGMPVLEAWKSTNVIVLKRSMGTGYSGVDNPLFYNENTDMLFGDAKKSVDEILHNLRNHS